MTAGTGKRSGKQTFLLVLSIIVIVIGALAIVASVMLVTAGSMLYGELGREAAQQGLGETYDVVMSGTGITGALVMGSVILIVASVLELLLGIMGVRASKNANKTMGVIVLCIIALVLDIIGLISGGTLNIASVIGIVLVVVILVLGFSIKNDPASLRS